MITSSEVLNERGQLVRIEVETTVGSDDVRLRVGPSRAMGDGLGIILTRREAEALRSCLSDVKED